LRSRRLDLRHIGLVAAAILIVAAVVAGGPSADSVDAAVVAVDSVMITAAEFDSYARVFILDSGDRALADEYVLLALVNQTLVLREADRRGIDLPEEIVDAQMSAAINQPMLARSLTSETERASYRDLLARKLRFDAVKQAITGHLSPTAQIVEDYFFTHREDYPLLTLEDVSFEIMTILRMEMVETSWRAWLARERACARIRVVNPAFALPPETYEGQCTAVAP